MPNLLAQAAPPDLSHANSLAATPAPSTFSDIATATGDALQAQSTTSLDNNMLTNLVTNAQDYLVHRGPDLAERIVLALLIVYVGQWAAKLTFQFLLATLRRAGIDETLSKFSARIAQAGVLTFVAMAALTRLGVDTTSVTAAIAAAGLAVGLALQGSLSNFAAGVMLVLFRPFSVGDFVEAGGTKGIVEEIHVFHTVMRTPDNVRIIVPNGAITASNISNYSAEPIRRIDLVVGCAYSDNLLAVKQFLQEIVDRDPRVRRDPAPVVAVNELADNSVNFVVRPWVASPDYWQTRWDLVEAIKLGFDAHGFQIPFPQRDVHIHRADAVAAEAQQPELEHASKPSKPMTNGLVAPRRVA